MKLFPLLAWRHRFQIGLLPFLVGLFPALTRHADVRDLTPYLRRDVGLSEDRSPDRDRLLG